MKIVLLVSVESCVVIMSKRDRDWDEVLWKSILMITRPLYLPSHDIRVHFYKFEPLIQTL